MCTVCIAIGGGNSVPTAMLTIVVIEKVAAPGATKQQAAEAIVNYFLTNADTGNHTANDELIAELARRQRKGSEHPRLIPDSDSR